jgi:hypothetical protein
MVDLPRGFVAGRFVQHDGETPESGSVKLTPLTPTLIVNPGAPSEATTAVGPATLHIEGGVIRPKPVIATRYKVTFSLAGTTRAGFEIDVTTAHTVESPCDLTRAAPLEVTPAVKWVVNEQVYVDTLAARDVAISAEASAEASAVAAARDAEFTADARDAVQSSAAAASESAGDALAASGDAHASAEVATAQASAAGQSAFSAGAFASAADGSRISAADAAAASVQLKLDTEQYKIQAEAAAALALSGQFAGSRIPSGVHLDTVTAQGVYFQNQTSDIATENGYPVAGNPGRGTMLVFRWAAAVGNYFQVYFTIGDNSDRAVMYVRRGGTSSGVITWGAWRVTPTLSYGSLGEMLFFDGSANRQLKPIGGAFSSGNLDNLTAAGSYYNTTTTTATIGNNWPIAGVIGEVDVIPVSPGGNLIQVVTPMGGTMLLRGQYRRSKASGTFGPWRFTPTSYVDQTAGRTLSLWDDVNNRLQMVYGDTGWRDISSLLENNWGGKVQVLRTGSSVEVRARTLVAGTAVTVFTLPTGFRPGGGSSTLSFPIMARPASNSATPIYGTVDAFGAVALRTDAGAFNDASLQFTFTTRDTWPTSLPGIAVGSIPT